MNKELERIQGVILGTAIGDALGAPTEFMSMESIKKRWGRVEDFVDMVALGGRPQALYTDDTQMMRAVCEGLIRARTRKDLDKAAEEVAMEFIAWSQSVENNRAPGGACMLGCRNLAAGMPWREAGKLNGGGCGGAMRSMAYGAWFDAPLEAAHWAGEHCLMTHRLGMAQASSSAVAAIISALRTEDSPHGALPMTDLERAMRSVTMGIIAAERYDRGTASMIEEALNLALGAKAKGTQSVLTPTVLDKWRGWVGHEAVAASVYCFMLAPESFKDAVLWAINSPGDSDSLGAITGAFSGAFLGADQIPAHWKTTIEKSSELHVLASRLHRAKNSCE